MSRRISERRIRGSSVATSGKILSREMSMCKEYLHATVVIYHVCGQVEYLIPVLAPHRERYVGFVSSKGLQEALSTSRLVYHPDNHNPCKLYQQLVDQ